MKKLKIGLVSVVVVMLLALITGCSSGGSSSNSTPPSPSTNAQITGFTIAGQVGETVINQEKHTINVTMPIAANITNLSPTITVSSGASVFPASNTAMNFTYPCSLLVTNKDGQHISYTVTVTNGSSANNITSFSIPNALSTHIDNEERDMGTDGVITVYLPQGSEISALTPIINVSSGASVSPTSDATENFTNGVKYTVTAQNKSIRTYFVWVMTNSIFQFSLSGGEATVTGFHVDVTPPSNIVIPSIDDSGNRVVAIGMDAFSNYKNISSVTLSSMLTSIGTYAFEGCTAITSITIPNNVIQLGSSAFADCNNLQMITVGTGVTSLPQNIFQNISPNAIVTFNAKIQSIASGIIIGDISSPGITVNEKDGTMGDVLQVYCSHHNIQWNAF